MEHKTVNLVVQVSAFRAALLCAGKKDVRYYLNGVMVEITSETTARLVSTDGHRLFAVKNIVDMVTGSSDEMPTPGTQYIIPRDTLEWILKGISKKTHMVSLVLPSNGPSSDTHGEMNGQVFKFIDGRFPDYKRIIPEKTSGEPGNYNPQYLLDAHKALATLSNSTPASMIGHTYLLQNGSSAGVMRTSADDALVIIMPVSVKSGLDESVPRI